MEGPPTGVSVLCPSCDNAAYAIVPKNGEIVKKEENADGKVWVNCHECGARFLAYYQTK